MASFERPRHPGAIAGVFLASLTILGWNAGTPGIATAYVDPVAKIQAQDEAYYGSISLEMAKSGDWLTPRFLDRYALVKPPLLYWLQAAGIKVLGNIVGNKGAERKALALRWPSIIAGSATVALIFAWLLVEGIPLAAAAAGAILLLSSHLFFVLSRIGLTDALLTFETALAMFALARDPKLASRASLWTFGLASGAALMTKGIAGLFSWLALALLYLLSLLASNDRSEDRPNWWRLAHAVAISAAVALPWHLYQLIHHTRWFWAEYILTEVVTNSVGKPDQTSQESQIGFYLKRLVALDAPLFAAALVTLTRRRPRVLLAWIVVVLAAALSFEYRNAAYLLPLFPAMALLAGGAIPKDRAKWALGLVLVLFVAKASMPAEAWGLPFKTEAPLAAEPVLDRYAALKRGNGRPGSELILGDPNDEFYSACLDLPRVRYLYLDPITVRRRYSLDLEYLGVLITSADFARLPELHSEFGRRLKAWGLDRGDPTATAILAPTLREIQELVRDHPLSDFLVPVEWAELDGDVHEIQPAWDGRELLLSREVVQRP